MRARSLLLALAGTLAAAQAALADPLHVVRYEDHGPGARRLIERRTLEDDRLALSGTAVRERSYPQFYVEQQQVGPARIVELKSRSVTALLRILEQRGVKEMEVSPTEAADEVVTLVDNGPTANRIDLVFMGDGYTAAEKDKFYADIRRLVGEMFDGDTFHSFLPLFNVHAVFRASQESGIGKNSRPKRTAYKLSREGDTLRAIYPGDMAAIRDSCSKAPDCDYKVMIANDPYYGGLGGEVAISTSSPGSGIVVLRHELGHTFGDVGEEYDGGGYFGANWARTIAEIGWKPWATEPEIKPEPAVARVLGWPWHNLKNGPYKAKFTSDGQQAATTLRFSASGMGNDGDLRVQLDGRDFAIRGPNTDDRKFYNFDFGALSAGDHEIVFTETQHDGNNYVSSLDMHEYGAGFHFDNDFVGAYPVFAEDGSVDGYRSNFERCLMRNMESTKFCVNCQENLWLKFLATVKLIDGVDVVHQADTLKVTVNVQKLGDYEVRWTKDGVAVPELDGQLSWTRPEATARGSWDVQVRFVTPEVKQDPDALLTDRKTVRL